MDLREMRMREMAEINTHLEPNETLFAKFLGPVRPDYARKTITTIVEPYHALWLELEEIIPSPEVYEDDLEGPPYSPTMRRLMTFKESLWTRGFQEVPNPAYDPEKAEIWEKAQDYVSSQRRVTWGMSEMEKNEGDQP